MPNTTKPCEAIVVRKPEYRALSIAQPPLPHTITGNVSFFGNASSVVGRKTRWPGEPNAPSDVTLYGPGTASGAPSRGNARWIISGVMPAGCAIDSTRYSGFLTTIASHGFLVLGTAAQEGAARRQATADNLRAAIDWAEKENARTGSPLKGKIAMDKVAVMGQSCGGFLSVALGADPRVKTIGVFNSGVQKATPGAPPSPFPTSDALPKLHGPVLLINGHEPDFMMAQSAATFDMINHVPAFYGARHNASHTATVFHPGGGEFANVASNWLSWTFKGDKKAGKMFAGKDCSLCTNSNWDVKSKGIK